MGSWQASEIHNGQQCSRRTLKASRRKPRNAHSVSRANSVEGQGEDKAARDEEPALVFGGARSGPAQEVPDAGWCFLKTWRARVGVGGCNVSLANAGQSLFNLHLSGDWHHSAETLPHGSRPHMMRRGRELLGRALVCRVWGNAIEAWRAARKHVGVNMSLPRCMLISNLAVDQVSVCVSPPLRVRCGLQIRSPALRERHSGADAAMAPGVYGEQAEGAACLLPRQLTGRRRRRNPC